MNRLTGKVAFITGGNSGIGLATAKLFYEEGAKVVITGRNTSALKQAKQEFEEERFLAVAADVAKISDIEQAVQQAHNTFGKLDVIFPNAGITKMGTIDQVTEEVFDQTMNTNFKGVFFTLQKALPYMNDGGTIVLNGSVNGQIGFSGASVYSASKAAIHSLAQTLAAELKDRKIRVNAMVIGPTDTPLFSKLGISQQEIQGFSDALQQRILLRRFASPEEIAQVALFLATDASSFIDGISIPVDGGLTVNTL